MSTLALRSDLQFSQSSIRLLNSFAQVNNDWAHSHKLAELAGVDFAQFKTDLSAFSLEQKNREDYTADAHHNDCGKTTVPHFVCAKKDGGKLYIRLHPLYISRHFIDNSHITDDEIDYSDEILPETELVLEHTRTEVEPENDVATEEKPEENTKSEVEAETENDVKVETDDMNSLLDNRADLVRELKRSKNKYNRRLQELRDIEKSFERSLAIVKDIDSRIESQLDEVESVQVTTRKIAKMKKGKGKLENEDGSDQEVLEKKRKRQRKATKVVSDDDEVEKPKKKRAKKSQKEEPSFEEKEKEEEVDNSGMDLDVLPKEDATTPAATAEDSDSDIFSDDVHEETHVKEDTGLTQMEERVTDDLDEMF